jgi:methylmalonyl-CoA/ethylmalonyl-CoA epimerase
METKMAVKSLNHIGIAVRSIDEHKPYYEQTLGLEFEGFEDVPSQKVRVAFFRSGDVRIELLEPTDPQSAVGKFLEKRGEGLHHLAFTADDR